MVTLSFSAIALPLLPIVLLLLFLYRDGVVGQVIGPNSLGNFTAQAGLIDWSSCANATATVYLAAMWTNTTVDQFTLQHDKALANLRTHAYQSGYCLYTEVYIYENDSAAYDTMVNWADRNFSVIIVSSTTYGNVVSNFIHLNRTTPVAYYGTFFVPLNLRRVEQFNNPLFKAACLGGYICGSLTKTNTIGYVANQLFSNTVSNINAFAACALLANPLVNVTVSFTNVVYDPLLEYRTGDLLRSNYSVDCAITTQDGQPSFERAGVPTIGWDGDIRPFVGQHVITSFYNNPSPAYIEIFDRIVNGSFGNSRSSIGLMGTDFDIAPFSPVVSPDLERTIYKLRDQIIAGTFHVFCGRFAAAVGYNATYTTTSGNGTNQIRPYCLTDAQVSSSMKKYGNLFNFVVHNPKNISNADIFEYNFVDLASSLGIILVVLAAVLIATSFVMIIGLANFWRHPIMQKSSPELCLVILMGCSIGMVSVFAWIGAPLNAGICQWRIWPFAVGFGLTFGGLLVKNYRIWHIFTATIYTDVKITTLRLFGYLSIILAGEIVILVIWIAVDPFVPIYQPGPLLQAWQFDWRCGGTQQVWGIATLFAYNVLIVAVGMAIFVKLNSINEKARKQSRTNNSSGNDHSSGNSGMTPSMTTQTSKSAPPPPASRSIIPEDYNEAGEIGQVFGLMFCALVVAVVLLFAAPYTVTGESAIMGFAILIMFGSVEIRIFGAKFWRIYHHKPDNAPKWTSSSAAKTSTQDTHRSGAV